MTKTNEEKSREKREKNKVEYRKMARFLKSVINILERTHLHLDIKQNLTQTYNSFKLKGEKR